MADSSGHVLICSCDATMPLDPKAVQRGCGTRQVVTAEQLCGWQLDRFLAVSREEGPLTVGCTQQAALFSEAASAGGRAHPIVFCNICENARWAPGGRPAG